MVDGPSCPLKACPDPSGMEYVRLHRSADATGSSLETSRRGRHCCPGPSLIRVGEASPSAWPRPLCSSSSSGLTSGLPLETAILAKDMHRATTEEKALGSPPRRMPRPHPPFLSEKKENNGEKKMTEANFFFFQTPKSKRVAKPATYGVGSDGMSVSSDSSGMAAVAPCRQTGLRVGDGIFRLWTRSLKRGQNVADRP